MYTIGIPTTIQQIVALLHLNGLWSVGVGRTLRECVTQLFYFIYFAFFVVSIVMGACVTVDKDESIFLTVVSILTSVQAYRLYYIIRRKVEIRSFIRQVGSHCTSDEKEFTEIDDQLKRFMILSKYFILMGCVGFICTVLSPVATNERKLVFNIGILTDRENDSIEFWLAYAFVAGGIYISVVCYFLTAFVWYLMISFMIKYKMLGNQFSRIMGGSYYQDFIAAIKAYGRINKYTKLKLKN